MLSFYATDRQVAANAEPSSLISVFQSKISDTEQLPKVFTEDRSMSFTELDIASDHLAQRLLGQALPQDSLVSLLLPRSIEAIIGQLAILKAGAAYLPMSPGDFPLARLCSIFEDAQLMYVITDSEHYPLYQALQEKLGRKLQCIVIDAAESGPVQTDQSIQALAERGIAAELSTGDQLAYVMYTSGSTGKPKGVMITQQNILCSVTNTDYFSLENDDALLHAAPISFDAATFEVWAALLNGKDLYIVSEQTVHQLDAFTDFVNSRPVSIAWLTSALFNLLADTRPAFFKSFRQILVGGEALSPRHINLIRQRYPELILRNNYGPTENTIFSTSFLIDQDYQSNIPIGRAVQGKRAYILDNMLNKVARGMEGELFVAGQGVSPGYLNLPDETQRRFLPDPFFPHESMYATGDICRFNEQGNIEFIGRKDTQVKVSGHRIELGEIEAALSTCADIKVAVVLHKKVTASLKGLVAYLKVDTLDETQLRKQLAPILPSYMIPLAFEVIEELPLTVNGKVDRQLMQHWPLVQKLPAKRQVDQSQISMQALEAKVIAACKQVLNRQSVGIQQNFFTLGGDSLSGTSLMLELEYQLGITLPLSILYANPCINDLLQALADPRKTKTEATEQLSLSAEARLADGIQLRGRPVHFCADFRSAQCQIFLTGASGFFGAFLLKELLTNSAARVYCLVRAENERHAKQRLLGTFRKYKIPVSTRQIERITAIPGDLSQPRLGLSAEQHQFLTDNMDVIFHNGAAVNYVDTYATLKGSNVGGTHEILKLACQSRIIPLHYISSVSVFETLGFFSGKKVVYEHESIDLSERHVRLGYSQSKWVAEKMMSNAQALGLPVNIYRSGYIMGHTETGVSNTTDHIARYIAGCIEMGCAPILTEYASLSPVDQVSRALCHIALKQDASYGKTLHLCNPDFITVDEIYQKIQSAGFPLELMSYTDWKERLRHVPKTNPLYPLLSLHIHPAPDHELTLPELYEHNTIFDCTQFLKELEDSEIKISLQIPYLFERWLEDYRKNGLLSEGAFERANALDCIA